MAFWNRNKEQIRDLENRVYKLESSLTTQEYRTSMTLNTATDAQSRIGALARYHSVRFETVPAQGSRLNAVSITDEDRAAEERRFVPKDFADAQDLKDKLREAQLNFLKADGRV